MISVEWPKDSAPSYETWLQIAASFEAALASKDTELSEIRAELETAKLERDGAQLEAFFAKPLYSRRVLEEKLAAAQAELERWQANWDANVQEMSEKFRAVNLAQVMAGTNMDLLERATASETELAAARELAIEDHHEHCQITDALESELARAEEVEAAARNLLTLLLCVDFDRFTEHDELLLETVQADARTFLGTPAISQDDVEERR